MKKYTYIQNELGVIEFDFKLNSNYNTGLHWTDYENGCWIELNSDQINFYKEHPKASIYEIFYTQLNETPPPYVPTIEDEKYNKIKEIEAYDLSSEVNNFKINGVDVWLDKATRVGLMNAIQIEKSAKKTTTTLWLNDICFSIPCNDAIKMLSQLEIYALGCFNKTAEHKKAVKELLDIEKVKSYNYKTGYPQQLSFDINTKGGK